MGNANWDLAQLTDLKSRIGRLVPGTRITVPAWMTLSPDRSELIFGDAPTNAEIRVRHTQADPQMLTQFVALWNAAPEAILRYARRWGVLYLDQRGRPCHPNGPVQRREPIEIWRYFSRRAQAVVNIAANLKRGKPGEIDDWSAMRGTELRTGDLLQEMDRYAPFLLTMLQRTEYPFATDGSGVLNRRYRRSVGSEKSFLALEATFWLRLGRINFAVGLVGSQWQIGIDYNECMLAAIALQLSLVLADVRKLYQCSGCHLPYARKKRAPKTGQANFCENCGRKKALEMGDRRRRHKKSEAKRLTRAGMPVSKIARLLESSSTTIRKWTTDPKRTSRIRRRG